MTSKALQGRRGVPALMLLAFGMRALRNLRTARPLVAIAAYLSTFRCCSFCVALVPRPTVVTDILQYTWQELGNESQYPRACRT